MIGELTPAHRSASPQQPEQFVLDFDIRISKTFPLLCISTDQKESANTAKDAKEKHPSSAFPPLALLASLAVKFFFEIATNSTWNIEETRASNLLRISRFGFRNS